ncbi:hypothetical protein [Caulobacter sp. Root655]|uniref:hypothetical protein n=1 Tax=Caulobacter sp. Root655 TaxID=1736578 RepID=UPI000A84C1B0|nr:hypothetical protein [Caulobacter sp. Root655]
MDQGFSGEDLSRVIYLLLYLLVAVIGLRGMSRRDRRVGGQSAPARPGVRGWMDANPWAVGGAVWAFIIWGLLAARLWWLGQPGPAWVTLPLTVLGGLGFGWVLSRFGRPR